MKLTKKVFGSTKRPIEKEIPIEVKKQEVVSPKVTKPAKVIQDEKKVSTFEPQKDVQRKAETIKQVKKEVKPVKKARTKKKSK